MSEEAADTVLLEMACAKGRCLLLRLSQAALPQQVLSAVALLMFTWLSCFEIQRPRLRQQGELSVHDKNLRKALEIPFATKASFARRTISAGYGDDT